MMKSLLSFVFYYLILFTSSPAQTVLSGHVFDENKKPVSYMHVYESTGGHGTTTDINGFFSIKVMKLPVSLEFSNVGYDKLRTKVVRSDSIIIVLSEKIIKLSTVTVNGENPDSRYIGSPKNKRGINSFVANKPFFSQG